MLREGGQWLRRTRRLSSPPACFLAALFMEWYGHIDSFGPDYSLSGWQALGREDVLMAFAALAAAGSVMTVWTAGEGSGELVIGAGVVAVALCVWRIVSPPEIADSRSGGACVSAVAAAALIASGLAWRAGIARRQAQEAGPSRH